MSNFKSNPTLDVDDLADGLYEVARIGLVTERLVRFATAKPALARLLSLDLLGPPDVSLLLRASNLADVLCKVLPRLGEGRLASAADALLSISPEYRGQSWEQRRNAAEYMWRPNGYREPRYFYRPRQEIIRAFATELAFYCAEQPPRPAKRKDGSRSPAPPTNSSRIQEYGSGVPIYKTKYTRYSSEGKLITRYAFRAKYQGRYLTKFVSREAWNALSITFYDVETRQKIEAIPVV